MRVLMAIPSFPPAATGGAENAVFNITHALLNRGVHAEVLTFNLERRWDVRWSTFTEAYEGLKVHRWGGVNPTLALERTRARGISDTLFGHRVVPRGGLLRLLERFDIVHFNDEVNLSLPLYCMPARRIQRVFQHRTLVQTFRRLERSPASRWILRRAGNLFLVDGAGMREKLLRLGIDRQRIRELRKGVNVDRFVPGEGERRDHIIFAGRLDDRNKGVDLLLQALDRTSFRGELHVFPGTYEETPYTSELRHQVAKLENKVRVTIHGLMTQDELIPWYQQARLFVLPARMDTMPNVVLEEMACATPVVASKTGGMVELSDMGAVRGVEPGSVGSLASAIDELLANPEHLTSLGTAGRKAVQERFSFDRYVDGIVDVYHELLADDCV